MEAFLGKWRVELEKAVGIDEMGKVFGWDEAKRKMYATSSYTLQIEKNGDAIKAFLDYTKFNITIEMSKFGEEVEYASPDGTKSMVTVRMEDGKMIEDYRTLEGIKWNTVRRIEGGNTMVAETTCEGDKSIKCMQYLTRI